MVVNQITHVIDIYKWMTEIVNTEGYIEKDRVVEGGGGGALSNFISYN